MLTVLKKTSVFKSDLFTVYKEDVRLGNGSLRSYASVERKPSVIVIPIDEKGNIYMVDQYRHIYNRRLIEFVAGMIEKNENPLESAKRELKEEAGIIAKKWKKLIVTKPAGSIITWDQHIFLAEDLEFGDSEPEENEDIKVLKLDLKSALKKVIDGKIETSPTIAGLLMISILKNKLTI